MENVGQLVSRKERRKLEEKRRWSRQMRKGTAIVGTTLTACSLAAPLAEPVKAEAAEAGQTSRATNTSAFIAEIAAHAQPVAQKNDLFASVMIAQAIVESGWGQSTLARAPYYNLFGIKGSYQGQSVYMDTQEYLDGKWVTMKEPFRDYPSFQQSFEDNASVLRNVIIGGQHYYRGAWKSNCSSYRDATAWLTGRYATAPHYATALNNVIESYNLTRFDTPASGSAGGGASTGSNNNGGSTGSGAATTNSYYTVKAGDSVWLIANNHGISMTQLVEWNGIKNNLIHPGQKLIVKKGSGSTSGGGSSAGNVTEKPSTSKPSTGSGSTGSGTTTTNSYYTVKAGDSVWLIANNHGISMTQLVEWNGIKNNLIHPGQKLIVKKGSGSTSGGGSSAGNVTEKPSTSKPSTGSGSSTGTATTNSYYTVKAGDSVWLIANNHGISMTQLVEWNGIKNNLIHPGQKLIVKKGSDSTSGSSSSAGNTTNKPATGTSNTGSSGTNSSAATTGNSYYTVRSGDSVWFIANKYGISMDQLIQWNGIKDNFIYPGQQVIVKKGSSASANTGNTGGSTSAAQTYKVVSGDSLWSISEKHGMTVNQLKELNNLKSDTIYVGQTLKVK